MTGDSRRYKGPAGGAASTTAPGGGNNAAGDNGNGGGNGRGGKPDVPPGQSGEHGQGKDKGAPGGRGRPVEPPGLAALSATAVEHYQESPAYLLEPTSRVTYDYDAVGNRTGMTTDSGTTEYEYDAADRLLRAGETSFAYDAAGRMTARWQEEDVTSYRYDAAGRLAEVLFADESYVRYAYDGFGRKVYREEMDWQEGPPGNAYGLRGLAPGQQKQAGQGSGGGSANGRGNGKGNGQGQGPGRGQALGHQKLRPVTQETRYLYDGLTWNVVKEYAGQGNAPLAQYYYANGRVIARKLFGLKGLVIPGREPHLQANGNLLYYHYDAQGNPALLTDQQGEVAEEYRYDAFGGLYTGLTAPYNTVGLTGKTYDPKAGLLDFATRWYDPALGRFMTPDVYRGTLQDPVTQHLYAYVGNNPVTRVDPLGMYWTDGEGNLCTGPWPGCSWYDSGSGGSSGGGDTGGGETGTGGGTGTGDSGSGGGTDTGTGDTGGGSTGGGSDTEGGSSGGGSGTGGSGDGSSGPTPAQETAAAYEERLQDAGQAGPTAYLDSQLAMADAGDGMVLMDMAPPPALADAVDVGGGLMLKRGDSGPLVVELQWNLAVVGYNPGYIDGKYGPNTERAVQAFQTGSGLEATGRADYGTWAAIQQAVDAAQAAASEEDLRFGNRQSSAVGAGTQLLPEGIQPVLLDTSITSPYGWRGHPVSGGIKFHNGVDIGAPIGTPVYAVEGGRVEAIPQVEGYGYNVKVTASDGTEYIYAHMTPVTESHSGIINKASESTLGLRLERKQELETKLANLPTGQGKEQVKAQLRWVQQQIDRIYDLREAMHNFATSIRRSGSDEFQQVGAIERNEKATVAAGELIGYVGTTGTSTGPHLHFEIRQNQQPVPPPNLPYDGQEIAPCSNRNEKPIRDDFREGGTCAP